MLRDEFKFIVYKDNSNFILSRQMRALLEEYHLYEDLVRINNDEYFQLNFRATDVEEVFAAIKTQEDYVKDRSCLFFLFNLKATSQKDVYLVLKWLVVTHRLLQLDLYPKIIEDILSALESMSQPQHQTPFESYLYEFLLKIYLQYLKKLCLYRLKRQTVVLENMQEFQTQLFFIRMNLFKFGTRQFMELIPQFGGFFKECYPFLSNYGLLIESDLKVIFKELKKQHRRQEEKLISWSQLEDYETVLQCIQKSNQFSTGCEDSLSEVGPSPCKVEEFFLSNVKQTDHY